MMYLDLEELDQLFVRSWLWSARRPALAWFRRRDHMGDEQVPLAKSILDFVEARSGHRPNGAVRLLTHLRYFGFAMNPVSFYFCFDKSRPSSQESLRFIVAEVNNTPWGEQHLYLLEPGHFQGSVAGRPTLKKEFHVSPFLPMNMGYRWQIEEPSQQLRVGITNRQDRRAVLSVTLDMQREEITPANLRRVLVHYPLMTVQVIWGIYWQAFRLWCKRTSFFSHPNRAAKVAKYPIEIKPSGLADSTTASSKTGWRK